jgi:hypothetical protein
MSSMMPRILCGLRKHPGGKDNFEAGRRAAEESNEIFPKTVESARACRAFLSRVVGYLTAEAGPRPRKYSTSAEQVTRLFDGLGLVEPGVVQISKWRPDSELTARTAAAPWGGVARKPLDRRR